MDNTITTQVGGLVLQINELMAILNEPDSVGLAFGVATPGQSANVDLLIYKVIEQNGELYGETRSVENKNGAAKYHETLQGVELFQFEHLEELQQCGFGFAYIDKAKFEDLIKDGEKEVFISGTTRNYGSTNKIKGTWFTLQIAPRPDDSLESIEAFGKVPDNYYMPPCPPIWTKGSGSASDTAIIFSPTS